MSGITAEMEALLEPVIVAARQGIPLTVMLDLDTLDDSGDSTIAAAVASAANLTTSLIDITRKPSLSLGDIGSLLTSSSKVFDALRNIEDGSSTSSIPGEVLLERLLSLHLRRSHPTVFGSLVLLGLIDPAEEPADSSSLGPGGKPLPRLIDEFHLDRLGDLFKDPLDWLRKLYFKDGFDTVEQADSAADRLFPRLGRLLQSLGVSWMYGIDPEHLALLGPEDAAVARRTLLFFVRPDPYAQAARPYFGATLALSPAQRGDLGLVVTPFGAWKDERAYDDWTFGLGAKVGVGAFAVGRRGLTLLAQGGIGAEISAKLARGDEPAFQIGDPNATHLELKALRLESHLDLTTSHQSLKLLAAADGVKLVVKADEGDSLGGLIPDLKVNFDAGIEWSNEGGLRFTGGGGLEADLPIHISLGDAGKLTLHLGLGAGLTGARVYAALSPEIKLGPLTVSVDRIGLEARLGWPDPNGNWPDRNRDDHRSTGGNLGPVDLSFGFVSPSGMAVKLDAGAVQGAGALLFKPEKHLYVGALQLDVAGRFGFSFRGLLQTAHEDGTPGLSFLAMGSFTFPVPISLAFGFTLKSVGGLVGFNRTAALEKLTGSLKNDQLGATLFPNDVPDDIEALVTSLGDLFPQKDGAFVIGLFVQINWLALDDILIDLGLLYDTSQPLRLTLLGRVKVNKGGVKLNILALGWLDLGEGELFFYATLFDSKIQSIDLSGDTALLVRWGDEPTFIMSVGGFHPRYPAPKGFPVLARVAAHVPYYPGMALNLEAYFAIAGGVMQFGARVELRLEVSGVLKAFGRAWFDALINLSFTHFWFDVEMGAELTIEVLGLRLLSVRLEARVMGPESWYVLGHVSIGVLFWDVEIGFEVGEKPEQPSLEGIDLDRVLMKELLLSRSWGESGRGSPLVSLREPTNRGQSELWIHPQEDLVVSQKHVPLGVPISRYGEKRPEGGVRTYELEGVSIGDRVVEVSQAVKEPFAVGLFQELVTDQEKLEKGGFARWASGGRLDLQKVSQTSERGWRKGQVGVANRLPQETIFRDSLEQATTRETVQGAWVPEAQPGVVVGHSASGQAPARKSGRARFQTTRGSLFNQEQIGELL